MCCFTYDILAKNKIKTVAQVTHFNIVNIVTINKFM